MYSGGSARAEEPAHDTSFLLSHLLGQLNMRHYSHSGAGVAWEISITSQMLMRVPKSPSPHQTDRLVRTRAARGTSTGSQMTQKLSKGHAPPSVQSHPKCRLMPDLGRSRAERGVLGSRESKKLQVPRQSASSSRSKTLAYRPPQQSRPLPRTQMS